MKHYLAFLLAASFFHAPLSAQEKITVGQSIELSGQATGKENMLGAQAYLNWFNSQGGLGGKKVELISYDDQRDLAKVKENTLRLINQDHVIALFGYRSTPTVQAILPMLEEYKIPLIAPFSGSQSLFKPLHPNVFNLRASYQEEAAKMVESLAVMKITKIAILHQDDSFGKDGLTGFEKSLEAQHLTASTIAKYDRKDLNVDAAVSSISAIDPQAVLMACTPSACADFVRKMRKLHSPALLLMLSNVNSEEFFSSLGESGRGIGVMQVMPYPRNVGVPIVREFQKVIKTSKNPPPVTYASLEGFVAAKLLVESLRRTGSNPTPQKLLATLESMHNVDLGGVTLSYSQSSHDGSHFVELSIIGRNGVMIR